MTDKLARTYEIVGDLMDRIVGNFVSGSKITVLVRQPNKPDQDFVVTSDELSAAIEALERRKLLGNQAGQS